MSLASMTLFSSLETASSASALDPARGASVKVGILVLLPLLASPEMYQFAVHMSPFDICLRKLAQCTLLAAWISFL